MASIRKMPNGKWRAEVYKNGLRRSKVCLTKADAKHWAAQQEISLGPNVALAKTLGDLLERYGHEVSPLKRGHKWETVRIKMFLRDPITRIKLADLKPADFAGWRDRRLRDVSPGTVKREINLLNSAINTARKEWRWLADNPLSDVRKPTEPPPRDRLPTDAEIERMAHVAGDDLTTATARAFHAFRFACETAMRAGEIVGLRPDDINRENRVARLRMTKNGQARDVPLSSAALALLDALPPADPVFGLTSARLDALFRKIKKGAAVEGLTFHDSRAFATGRLAKKLNVLDLARVTGHRDLNMLIKVYYRESAADLARRLD